MKKKKILNLDAFGVIALLVVFAIIAVLVLILYITRPIYLEGNPSIDFCTEKCGEKDYFSSVNDSGHNVILCECVDKLVYGEGKYNPVVRVDSLYLYFDSNTLNEISKEEFNLRIK